MDEILATIRRIIAEDERSSSPGARGVPADVSPAGGSSRGASDAREGVRVLAEPAGTTDILDLTDALDEDGGAQHVAPLRTASDAPPRVETEAAEPIEIETKPAEASPQSDRAADPSPTPPAAPPSAAPLPATSSPAAKGERLVSNVAALAAATAFGRLAAAPRVRREPPLVGGRPLDDIVRELLRPLLQTWLDENLPGIVEDLVKAEIARISARSGPG